MYAYITDYPPEIDRAIRALRSNGVPVTAVFPGDAMTTIASPIGAKEWE